MNRGHSLIAQALDSVLHAFASKPQEMVHFEGCLKAALKEVHESVAVERKGGAMWKVTIDRQQYWASVRMEATEKNLLPAIKRNAGHVKRTLLKDNQYVMAQVSRSRMSRCDLLNRVRQARDEEHSADQAASPRSCRICQQSLKESLLAGRHACRIIAKFKCPRGHGSWESKAARYNVSEDRPFYQKCKTCQKLGKCVGWEVAELLEERGPDVKTKPHMTDLCEACDRFGNCAGVFHEPFTIDAALEMEYGVAPTWQDALKDLAISATMADGVVYTIFGHVKACGGRSKGEGKGAGKARRGGS